jgi:hypothetical protein
MSGTGLPPRPAPWRFRSRDEWKAGILTLPDTACFDLLRSVFGNIKTPFNKHNLVESLTAFLLRREIQDAIAAYINDDDHRVIAAIALLGEPVSPELEGFFAGEYSGAETHGLLLNLEERLIVYRFRGEGGYRISLNPLLEPVLSPFIADISILFPSMPMPAGGDDAAARQSGYSPLDDRTLAALIAFAAAQGEDKKEFFKAGGGIRKKVIDDGRRIFPGLNIETFIEALRCIGLLETDGDRLTLERRRLLSFGKLSFTERMEYLAAGIFAAAFPAENDIWYFRRGRVQTLARFIHRFTGILDRGLLYPRRTLFRLVEILEKGGSAVLRSEERRLSPPPYGDAGELGKLLVSLEEAGLLRAAGESSGETLYTAALPPGTEAAPPGKPLRRPLIALDSPFSCILYPEIGFQDAITLASFCECRETGAVVRFELTRASAVRGFDQGLKAEDMTGILERLSLAAPDQNLIWTVKDWEDRYSSVSLFQGTVLTLAEDRRYLAETKALSRLILKTFAPGMYLLSVSSKDEAARILQKAGVDIIAQPPAPLLPEDGGLLSHPPYPSTAAFGASGAASPVPEAVPGREREAEERKKKFHELLRKSGLPKPDQDEIAARIERRQIVSESQLTGGGIRREKTEARNLDYAGKVLVAKQAIAGGSLVEILLPSADGGEKRVMGTPRALEKPGGDAVLVLRADTRSDGGETPDEDLRIPQAKIIHIRWIKRSIFTD